MTQPNDILDYSDPTTPAPVIAPTQTKSLRDRAVTGLALQTFGTVASKFINLAGQVAITYYVLPADYGIAGQAIMWTAYLSTIIQFGMADVAITNSPRYHRLERSINFIGMTLACAGMVISVALIPVLMLLMPQSNPWLLLIGFSTSAVVGVRSLIQLRQSIDIDYRLLTIIGLVAIVLNSGLTVGLAMAGVGAFALMIPPLVTSTFSIIWLVSATGLSVRRRGFFRLAPVYLRRGFPFLVANFLCAIWMTSDFLIVPNFDTAANAGRYMLAYSLSQQLVIVLGTSVSTTMFASLASLSNDRVRLQNALARGLSALWIAAVGFSVVQLAFTAPGVRLVFGSDYQRGIILVQIFTIAAAPYMTSFTLLQVLKLVLTPRRYNLQLLEFAVTFVASIVLGASWLGVYGAACASLVWSVYFMLRNALIALREAPNRRHVITHNFAVPLLAAAPALFVQEVLWYAVPQTRGFEWVQAILVCGVLAVSYPLIIRQYLPENYVEAKALTLGLGRRLFGRFLKA